jgi:hypothetical protein
MENVWSFEVRRPLEGGKRPRGSGWDAKGTRRPRKVNCRLRGAKSVFENPRRASATRLTYKILTLTHLLLGVIPFCVQHPQEVWARVVLLFFS